MSRGLNRVMVIGNLGADPELRYTPQGTPVASFRVAVNERYGGKETVEWFSIVAWAGLAEVCSQYLKKGSQVYIEGHLQTRSWEDSGGAKRYRTELVAQNLIMPGGRGEAAPDAEAPSDLDEIAF